MMPGAPGDALVQRLRGDPELAGLPVLVLTAKADAALRARLLSEGALDWVAKPVSIPELRARVRNLVAMKRARDLLQAELTDQAEDVERLAAELARRRREVQTALDAMRFAREQADRASAQKTTLMRLVSHELRTPISALVLQVERLRRDANQLSPYHRDAVGRMRSATTRLAGLVESLLEYSRIEAGRMRLEPEPLDAARIAADVVEELRPQAAQKGLALSSSPPGAASRLETDARLLRLVLLNLVQNGIKFTDAGSVTVKVEEADGVHRLAVSDTGRGVAKEDQGRIFEPFEQLETIAQKHTPGIGLGLTLVREMVSALGGRNTVDSEPGRGSTFVVTLPSRMGDGREVGAER
jgi:signal transduction histidine kinase